MLNVEITPGGKSVKKRKGYGLAFTLTYATSAVHGTYNFYDANGNDVSLYFNDVHLSASVSGASPAVVFSTGPNGATWQCTDSLGFAYCANTARTTLIKTNGVTSASIQTVNSTGTMVAVSPTRLALSGFASAPSRIDLSKEGDFTTWTVGSLGSDAAQFTINAPGAKITHIVYAFGRLIWFKDTSFGYILIGNQPAQSDWVIKTVSFDVGTNDNTSVYREGILYFRGKDSDFYAFDGSNYQKISEDIATTVGMTQTRALNSWSQTTQADFASGLTNPQLYLSTTAISGSIVLATESAVSSFIDTTSVNFTSGTLTRLSTSVFDGSIVLERSVVQLDTYITDDATNINTRLSEVQQAFIASASQTVTGIQLRLKRTGSPGTGTLFLRSDNSNSPGTAFASQSFNFNTISTSYDWVNIVLSNEIRLSHNSRYWICLGGFGDSSNNVDWLSCSGSGCTNSAENSCFGGSSCSTGETLLYKVDGATYSSSGNIVSRSFDVGFTTNSWIWGWGSLVISSHVPTGATLTYETQTSSASGGVYETLKSVVSGSSPTSTIQQYIKYKASFTTADTSTSPTISDITLSMTPRRRPTGTYQSAIKNAPNITSWDSFSATAQDNDGTQSFAIRSSSIPFYVTDSSRTWTTISNGAIPSVTTGTSTNGVYFQIRDIFLITHSTQNPKLDDFTQSWFEGSAADKAYATYFDDKIWWSVTNGAGATTNNKILLYDLTMNGWLIFDLHSNGFYTRQSSLYFGSSDVGKIYKFGETESDEGEAIEAYWKSKDYYGTDPFVAQELANISIVSKSVANSSMSVTYATSGSSETAYVLPQYNPNGNFKVSNKNLPTGKTGNSFSIKFGNDAEEQPFEVFGVQVGIRPKTWVPTQ